MGSKFNPTEVTIGASKIIELSVIANTTPEDSKDGKYNLQANYEAKPIILDNGNVFLDLNLTIESSGAPTYDVNIVTRTMFMFPDGVSDKTINSYLESEGTVRAFDFARTYIKTITAFGIWDGLELPGIPVS